MKTIPGAKPTDRDHRQASASALDSARLTLLAAAREVEATEPGAHMAIMRSIAAADDALGLLAVAECFDREREATEMMKVRGRG